MDIRNRIKSIRNHIYENRGTYGILAGTALMTVVSHVIHTAADKDIEDVWNKVDAAGRELYGDDFVKSNVDRYGNFGHVAMVEIPDK